MTTRALTQALEWLIPGDPRQGLQICPTLRTQGEATYMVETPASMAEDMVIAVTSCQSVYLSIKE